MLLLLITLFLAMLIIVLHVSYQTIVICVMKVTMCLEELEASVLRNILLSQTVHGFHKMPNANNA